MNEQCLRQYIRSIISRVYNINAFDDLIMYIVMAITMQVVLSDIDDKYKNIFRRLSTIMFKKKRVNSDISELERLEQGELPIPNDGNIDKFYAFMDKIKIFFKIDCSPLTLWYALCLALNNESIIVKQLIHCKESISKDFEVYIHQIYLQKLKWKK